MRDDAWVCLTCGDTYQGWGNNPDPINTDETLKDRVVCSDCNAMYVIPARLGQNVHGDLYSTDDTKIGTFGTEDA